jgi:linoleoyl-CoA desaturase
MGNHIVGAHGRAYRHLQCGSRIRKTVTSSTAAMQELRREFEQRGWCRKATARVVLELLLNLSVAASGAAVFFSTPHILIQAAALVLVVAGSMGAATNTHNSSHYATSRKMWLNELLTYFGYPFFLGLSATFWWHQHVAVHHTSPNVIGVDQDADLAPWIARTGDEVSRSHGLRRFYYQHLQWLALPLLIVFNSFNMTKSGWLHLARCLANPHRCTRKHSSDLAALILTLRLLPPAARVAAWLACRACSVLAADGPDELSDVCHSRTRPLPR